MNLPLLACFLVITAAAFGDDDLIKIKSAYESAVKRATDPLRAIYVKELQKLLQKHTQANRLDEAAKVVAELQAIEQSAKSPMATAGEDDADTTKGQNERWFVKHTWRTAGGTFFAFDRAGVGTRTLMGDRMPFVWRATPDGLIEVIGEISKGSGMQTLFFRFTSNTIGYYGQNRSDVNNLLQK